MRANNRGINYLNIIKTVLCYAKRFITRVTPRLMSMGAEAFKKMDEEVFSIKN